MVAKITKKKTIVKAKKEPNPSVLLKKVASVSDSNKALQKEIKEMSKIFGENQKVLVSMKGMIDTLTSTLEHIQKQSKQINIIEDDTQKSIVEDFVNRVAQYKTIIYPEAQLNISGTLEFTGSPKEFGFKTKAEFLDFAKSKGFEHGKLNDDANYLITDSHDST